MTREEQDQALAAMGFRPRELSHLGWRRYSAPKCENGRVDPGYDLYVASGSGRYTAYWYRGIEAKSSAVTLFDDPVSAAAYLLIQAADQT